MNKYSKIDFEKLYREQYNKVLRLCMGYVQGDEHLAKDLLQEVFIKVWQHWDNFKGGSQRSTWLYRITVNTCLQQLRTDQKYIKTSIEILDKDTSVSESIDKEQQFKSLYSCIYQLSKENQSIILLELEGIPQKEIALIIGIEHNALRTRLNRIKSTLTKCVNNENI
ncbi:RNA polymerase sigma factor [uncultured Nonlabens sp.]|uniref:RNA polymerase sigma factor n=1 Tax=uncultured Nonlabens sp. TaxID=859306 RepID=UPI002624075D|nr:RNA polymerase sigma factor [uncultured Nonlabens sp.]